MTLNQWVNLLFSWFGTAVNWIKTCTLFNMPVLYILAAIFVIGVVLRAIIYRA